MQTMRLTKRQTLRIADLPRDYRVVGADESAPFVRSPDGQILRVQLDGRLTTASPAARDQLSEDGATVLEHHPAGIAATSPYTSVMD
ncbi:MAG: hypothetical protein ACLQBB_07200 [Solirubrobacteraceae bacterium]